MALIIVSGYFDPLHVGHLEYIKMSRQYSDCERLLAILNNDKQCELKKGKSFMNEDERKIILESIRYVDKVIMSIDEDRSVCKTLSMIKNMFPNKELIFANGGDAKKENCMEEQVCMKLGIKTLYGLGEKIQSSSWLTGIKEKNS